MKRALAIVIALMSVTGAAHADDKDAAERYFRAGSKAYSAQNFAAASADFDEAYKAMPLPEIAFSAAQAYRRLYRLDAKPEYVRRSVELYRVYLQQVKSGGRVGDAADSLGEMERELDRLGIKLTASTPAAPAVEHTRLGVSVTIAGQASDTALREVGDATGEVAKGLHATLDGKPIEPFALVDVDAREHVIAVTADGYQPAEKHAVAIAGQSQLIELELHAKPATVTVHTESDATVSLDGRAAPGFTLEVPSGKHLLVVTHRGREPFGKELVLARGESLAVAAPLRETARRRTVPWVLTGAGALAAGALTTGIVALVRDSHASDLRDRLAQGNQPASTADDYDHTLASRDHFVTATWILGSAAVAAGATGVLLYLFDQPSAESVHLAPVIGPTSGAAMLTGRF
ncbi:MAG TPA: hypothetical protein VFQ65_10105 [Kofleriaceae bacterium]|nr:hypothetical protein [Kofleriaceae bacterium]